MPFDGSDFHASSALPTGLFSVWSRHGWRFRVIQRLCRNADHARLAPDPRHRDEAVVRLLQNAKGLIEDDRKWGQVWYFSIGRRRCMVGALRTAAKRVDDPSVAWKAHRLLLGVAQSRGFNTVEAMNDRSSHAEVLRAFDIAMHLAEGRAR